MARLCVLPPFPAALLIILVFLFINTCSCFNPKLFHALDATSTNQSLDSTTSGSYSKAVATWYGSPNGAGSDGGACGYTTTVSQSPINSMVAAGSSALFEGGKGCGACYMVKCTTDTNAACSGNPVKVMIMDQAPELLQVPHFDFGGIAMGAMATDGNGAALRNAGQFYIQYQRTDCNFRNPLKFKVDSGSNMQYMAVIVEYEDGKTDIKSVEVKESGSTAWEMMAESWGAVYKLDAGHDLAFPLSLRVTLNSGGNPIVAADVIPKEWAPGSTYAATSNFP